MTPSYGRRRWWRATALLALAGTAACGHARGGSAAAVARFPAGDSDSYRVASRAQHAMRRVWVYTPPGYAASRDTLGLIVAFDGGEYVEQMGLPRILDSLLAVHAIAPHVAVMIDDSSGRARIDDLGNRAWFADWVADELLPWVRARWRVTRDPGRVIVTGSSAGGLAAAYFGLTHPHTFGNVLSQSGAFWRGAEASNDAPYEWLATHAARGPHSGVRFWLEVGSTETRGTLGGTAPSILAANRALRDTLRAHGDDVTYVEVQGGVHAPRTWAPRLPVGLAALGRAAPR